MAMRSCAASASIPVQEKLPLSTSHAHTRPRRRHCFHSTQPLPLTHTRALVITHLQRRLRGKPVVAKRAPAEPCHPIKTRLKRWSCAPCTATGVTCVAFWPSIPPLQVVPSFACSVASLSRCPGHQLPGRHGLRQVILADYLLDQGGPSTCIAGHVALQCTPSPQFNKEQEA